MAFCLPRNRLACPEKSSFTPNHRLKMKALKDKRILILLIPLFAFILLYLLRHPDPHFSDSEDFLVWTKEDIQVWSDKGYVSLEDWESLIDFLRAHRKGTYEAWSRFRFNGDQPELEAPMAFIM